MREIKKKIGSILKAEFPEIRDNLIIGVIYLLFSRAPGKEKTLTEEILEGLTVDKVPPYTKNEKDEILLEALVKAGREMCQKPELLALIEEIMADLRRTKSEERSHDKSSKRKGDDNDESEVALLTSSPLKRLKK